MRNQKRQETEFFGTKSGNANSIAVGYATETNNYGEIAMGVLNKSTRGSKPNTPEGIVGDPEATLFSVGIGDKDGRKNALEVKGDGSMIISDTKGGTIDATELIAGIPELEEKVDDLDKEVGDIKQDLSKLGSAQGVIELEIGDSLVVKVANLQKLRSVQTNDHTFFTDINYGYGTGSWLPATGGSAFIITAGGNAVTYTIGIDGAVTKDADINLSDISAELFQIVTTLPTENIKKGKIYCVKDNTSTDPENIYLEWVYLENGWEKLGEYKVDVDLSSYAKVDSDNAFTGKNTFSNIQATTSVIQSVTASGALKVGTLQSYGGHYLTLDKQLADPDKVYATDGGLVDMTNYAAKSDVEQVKDDLQYVMQQDTILDQVSYGIEWDASTGSSDCVRIGNLSMHKSLPIQSQMRGVVHQHGVIQYYLDPNDWSKKEDGTPSRLDGYDGEVGVTMPKFYLWSESEGTKRRVRISEIKAVPYAQEMPAHILGAKRAVRLNSVPEDMGYLSTLPVNSLVSICNTSDYCTGSQSSASDSMKDTYIERTRFGKAVTNTNRATARAQAKLAGNQLLMYNQYKALFWLYYIEYANLNCQATFNAEPTSEGYKQGGLGAGVTNFDGNIWSMFNGNYPIFTNDAMNEYGNFTAEKKVTLPAFDVTTRTAIISNYSKNGGTTWTIANNTATITKATSLNLCYALFYYGGTVTYTVTGATEENPIIFYETSINNPVATATSDGDITVIWGNNTHNRNIGIKTVGDLNITITIKSTTNTTINVPAKDTQVNSYRGVQEPFGSTWLNIDGVIVNKASDGVNNLYVTDNVDFGDNVSNMTLVGTRTVGQNCLKDLNLGEHADLLTAAVSDYNSSNFKDYHWDNNDNENGLFLVGGAATDGSNAGLASFTSRNGLGGAWAHMSFRIATNIN